MGGGIREGERRNARTARRAGFKERKGGRGEREI